jgi:hypothetical protein
MATLRRSARRAQVALASLAPLDDTTPGLRLPDEDLVHERAEVGMVLEILDPPGDEFGLSQVVERDERSAVDELVVDGTTTDVIDGRFTDTASGFHVHGVIQRAYTIGFDDGTHIVGHVTEHFDFNTGTHSTTDTGPSQETATVYAADGRVLGTIRLHDIFHVRYEDTNGTGTPEPGEISAWVERSHLSCP